MTNRLYQIICILFLYTASIYATNESGLLFRFNNVNKDLRSSLHLTPNEPFKFSKSFCLEFDLKLQDTSLKFGYIFRMIFENSTNFDLLMNVQSQSNSQLLLVSNKNTLCEIPITSSNLRFNDWNHIKLVLDKTKNDGLFEINTQTFKFDYKLTSQNDVDICFGVNKKAPFVSSDTPPIILKNVYVNIDNKQKEYLWELNKHKTNLVLDVYNAKEAAVTNPVWLIDKHVKWETKAQLKFPSKIFAVYDEVSTLFLVSSNKVYAYNLVNSELNEYAFNPEIPITKLSNQFLYDYAKKQIVYADFDSTKPVLSTFNFNTSSWSFPITHSIEASYQHHNNFYSPIDSSLFQIFGYGFYKYKSDVKQLSKNSKYNSTSFSPQISPRYLSATGIHNSSLFIFGGVGNQTGKQEYGTQIYNDLYEVNLKNLKIEKRWERNPDNSSEVAARNLIIDKSGKKAMTLFFNPTLYTSYLLLTEVDLQQDQTRTLGDTIPYIFQDTNSEALLLFSGKTNRYYAVTIHKSETSEYVLNIFEISYPVLMLSDVLQSDSNKNTKWWLLAVSLLILAGVIVFFKRKKKAINTTFATEKSNTPVSEKTSEHIIINTTKTKQPGLYLLGGFQVIDKDNRDRTGEFTPIMKHMLSLIILYTLKNGKGVSNVKLKELLWFDKTDESARNNRSVNISKIKVILNSASSAEIKNDNSYWYIDFKDDAYCDYNNTLAYLKIMKNDAEVTQENVSALLEMISAGDLLPNIQEDWMDGFKAEYSNQVLDVLLLIIENENLAENTNLLLQIADVILSLDNLNEDALKLKCISLVKLGRIKIAKDIFSSFCKEYKLVLNEDFECSFENFVKK